MESSIVGKFLRFDTNRSTASTRPRSDRDRRTAFPNSDKSSAIPLAPETEATAAEKVRVEAEPLPARSVFHEPWWLDIATDGNWEAAKVRRGNEIVGEMPYSLRKKGFWVTSKMPPLTRTLGPAYKSSAGDATKSMLDRISITEELIAQIPEVDSFYQIFDPRIEDALAFGLHGFTISTRYTLQFTPERDVEALWKALNGKTRNLIRTGQKLLKVARLEPGEFNRFYESNLAIRSRNNIYGAKIMQQLIDAFIERDAGYLLGAHDARGKLVAAIGVTFDRHSAYYILSSREPDAHAGAISVLIWEAIQDAKRRNLVFDFDGIPNSSTFRFLCGFKPALKPRLVIERHTSLWAMAKASQRVLFRNKSGWFVATA